MVIVIDNYDSFTYNLVQFLGELGATLKVYRNDEVPVATVAADEPSHIVISPGPGTPQADSGISNELIETMGDRTPILGVCLGQQCIGHVHGCEVSGAPAIMHGKTSQIHHDGEGLFKGIANPFTATRYHSLIIHRPVSPELAVTAWTADGDIMGVRHRSKPIHGFQFHPESFLTQQGHDMLQNFLDLPGSNGRPD